MNGDFSNICNRSNAMTFIHVKVTINFTVRAHQLCGNWRSKALPPPIALSLKGEAVGGVRAATPPAPLPPLHPLEIRGPRW